MIYIAVITWHFGNEEEFYTVENSHITGCKQRNKHVAGYFKINLLKIGK